MSTKEIMMEKTEWTEEKKTQANALSNEVIAAAIEVHRHLGPGLWESAYEECLCYELRLRGIPFRRQVYLGIEYKGLVVPESYRIDVWVDDLLIVDIKSVETLEEVHTAQVLTYLRFTNSWLGLLLNFRVKLMKDGIERVVL